MGSKNPVKRWMEKYNRPEKHKDRKKYDRQRDKKDKERADDY